MFQHHIAKLRHMNKHYHLYLVFVLYRFFYIFNAADRQQKVIIKALDHCQQSLAHDDRAQLAWQNNFSIDFCSRIGQTTRTVDRIHTAVVHLTFCPQKIARTGWRVGGGLSFSDRRASQGPLVCIDGDQRIYY